MSCEVQDNCFGFDSQCWRCKFSGDESNVDNCYVPMDKKIKHPQAVAAKKERKDNTKAQKQFKKQNKDKYKSKIVKGAAKVEERVKSTLNSGRINRDGDLSTADLAIDVKHQPTRSDAVILADEFKKIQNDAIRAGKEYGVLVIVNKDGDTYYVIPEELFKEKFI